MGRRRADSKPGEFTISGQMEDAKGRVPAGDYGCLQRSQNTEGGLHDGQPVWEDRDHQQHLWLLHRSRSQPDVSSPADFGNGQSMVAGSAGTIDPKHSGDQGTDRKPEGQGRRQHDHPEDIRERGTVEHCRIEQPSRVGEQTNPDCADGRDRPNADVSRSRGRSSNSGNSEDGQFLQSENLSRFDSYGQRRIAYRGSI